MFYLICNRCPPNGCFTSENSDLKISAKKAGVGSETAALLMELALKNLLLVNIVKISRDQSGF